MTSQIHILSAPFEARGSGRNAFPLAHSPHSDKGTVGGRGPLSSVRHLPGVGWNFPPKTLFILFFFLNNEKVSSFPGMLHCLLSHSPFVLGLSDARRLEDMLGTSSQTQSFPGSPGRHPMRLLWKLTLTCGSQTKEPPCWRAWEDPQGHAAGAPCLYDKQVLNS